MKLNKKISWFIILLLEREEPLTAREISNETGIDVSIIYKHLKSLTTQNIVICEKNANNNREYYLQQ